MKKIFQRLNAGIIILSLIDLSQVFQDGSIKEIVKQLKDSVKGRKVKITSANIKYFGIILGYLTENNIEDLANIVKLSEEVDDEE